MSTMQGRVRQWALVEGVRQVHSDLLVARAPTGPRSTRRAGHVFVAVQPVDNAVHGRAACALVAETIATALNNNRGGSITSALRRAFAAAHDALCAHNGHVPPPQRTLVGACCVVVHNTTLYIAQVQPAHAWVQHNGHLRAFPPAAETVLVDAPHALGSPLYTPPEFMHVSVAVGDVLVLCSPEVVHALGPGEVEMVLRTSDANAVADGLYDLCAAAQVYAAHVLVIEWAMMAPERVEERHGHAHPLQHPLDDARVPDVLAHEQSLPTNAIATRTEHHGSKGGTHATLRTSQPHTPSTSARSHNEHGTGTHPAAPPPVFAPPRGSRRNKKGSRPATQPAHTLRSRWRRMSWRWLATMLLACVVALVGLAVQQIRGRDTGVALAAITQVERALAEAERASTPAAAQQALATAQTTLRADVEPLVQSGAITTSRAVVWQEYSEVLGRYEQAMIAINRVSFVDDLHRVASLPGDEGLINRIVLGTPAQPGANPPLFLLDRSGSRVWEAGRPTALLDNATVVADKPVARVREALWRGDKLILLERGDRTAPTYRLLYQDGAQWVETHLARTDTMAPLDGDLPMATFGGNLYVWDRNAKQVWQYRAGQLSQPPTPTLGNIGGAVLDKVVDIAVDDRTYLLNSDGSIVVIENGAVVQQQPAPQLATPLSTTARFVVTGDWTSADGARQSGAIYVLDTQHERVVQLDKGTGAVVQQLETRRHGTLNQLTDLAVDEAGRMLYLANGKDVLRTPLQPPPSFSVPAPPEPAK